MNDKPEMLGDAPIEPKHDHAMKVIASSIDAVLNAGAKGDDRKYGFLLMVFPFGNTDGRCNYISTANREQVVIMLKEQIKRFEGQPEIVGKA